MSIKWFGGNPAAIAVRPEYKKAHEQEDRQSPVGRFPRAPGGVRDEADAGEAVYAACDASDVGPGQAGDRQEFMEGDQESREGEEVAIHRAMSCTDSNLNRSPSRR